MPDKHFTEEEIADRITVSSRSLGADVEDNEQTNALFIKLANGQRFRIEVTELEQ